MPADDARQALPDTAVEAAIRALVRCPDVPEHAHVSMRLLTSMADDLGGDWRPALDAAFAAGRSSVLDEAEEVFAVHNGLELMAITAQDAAAIRGNRDRLYHAWRTRWQALDGTQAGREAS